LKALGSENKKFEFQAKSLALGDSKAVRERLNQYIKLRGDVVHRSRAIVPGPPKAHPVTKDDLERAVRFLRALVQATEAGLCADNT
jgi:hypothetical protein